MKRVFLEVVMGVVLTVVGCASVKPTFPPPGVRVVPFPDPKPGSWWLLRQLEGKWISRKELVAVDDNGFVVSLNGRMTRYTKEWNRTENVGQSGTIRDRYTESNSFLSFPLYPGKTWIVNVGWTGRRGDMSGGTFSVAGEAKAWENVSIGAEVFETVPVKVQIGNILELCWYAPAMKHLARCIFPYGFDKGWEVIAFHLAD